MAGHTYVLERKQGGHGKACDRASDPISQLSVRYPTIDAATFELSLFCLHASRTDVQLVPLAQSACTDAPYTLILAFLDIYILFPEHPKALNQVSRDLSDTVWAACSWALGLSASTHQTWSEPTTALMVSGSTVRSDSIPSLKPKPA